MAIKIVTNGPTERRVFAKSKAERLVDPQLVAKALGAEPVGKQFNRPLDVLDVRHALQTMVRSSGGRPGIATSAERVKIPRIEEDWRKIEELSAVLHEVGQEAPLGQIAAVVLHLALEKLPEPDIRKALLDSNSGNDLHHNRR